MKKILALLLVVCLAFAIVACGTEPVETEPVETTPVESESEEETTDKPDEKKGCKSSVLASVAVVSAMAAAVALRKKEN